MQRLWNSHEPRFKLLDARSGWTFRAPSQLAYRNTKGIELRWDHLDPVVPTRRQFAWPQALLEAAPPDEQAIRRWMFVFGPRIAAALSAEAPDVPIIFPGLPAILEVPETAQQETGRDGRLTYDRFLRALALERSQRFEQTSLDIAACSEPSWPWRYVDQPRLRAFMTQPPRHTNTGAEACLARIIKELISWHKQAVKVQPASMEAGLVRELFGLVHRAWSGMTPPPYAEEALLVSAEILHGELAVQRPVATLIALSFELEAFATYSTLLKRLPLVATGMFAGHWLDVATVKLSRLRGTERCEPARLFDELVNLACGNTAPLAINEFGCVTDGNHRLAAAWIWNILTACTRCDWSLQDEDFQQAVSSFISQALSDTTLVSLHEALACLGRFLDDRAYRETLGALLRQRMPAEPLMELPAVPLLEYSSFAVVLADYENGRCRRFQPDVYGLLAQAPDAVLPARVCYHFSDTAPLPWFSRTGASSDAAPREPDPATFDSDRCRPVLNQADCG